MSRFLTGLRGAAGAALVAACAVGQALGGEAVVTAVTARQSGGGSWHFNTTIRHADEGWEHYADMWRVRGPDGTVYGVRELFHPHVDEQTFTRSLSGVAIPADVQSVTVEAHDLVHGWGPPFALDLPR